MFNIYEIILSYIFIFIINALEIAGFIYGYIDGEKEDVKKALFVFPFNLILTAFISYLYFFI